MPTLPELVPDLGALLDMPPDALGPILMKVAEGMLQGGKFHLNNLLEPTLLYGRGIPTGLPVYPANRNREVELVVREGLQWLDHNGYTVPADTNGWRMFTRKGEDLLHPPAEAPRPAASEVTPFDRFEARQARRLRARVYDVEVELNRLHGEAIKAGAADGNRAIFPKLAAVEREAQAAVDAVLTEATALTANRGSTRSMWVEETAERARSVLLAHVAALYELNWRMRPDMMHTVTASIDGSRSRTLAMINGEVDDFEGGVWHPNSRQGEPARPANDGQGGPTPSAEVRRQAREPAASAELPPGRSVGVNDPAIQRPDYRAAMTPPDQGAMSVAERAALAGQAAPVDFGGVLTDGAGNVIEDGNGNPIETGPPIQTEPSGPVVSVGLTGVSAEARAGTLGVETSVGLQGVRAEGRVGTVTPVVQSGATVPGPPREIPEPGPALIEPEWADDRLTLPKRLPVNDLWDDAVVGLVAAVRAGFVELIDALAQSGTNFHPAARLAIEGIPDLLSGVPDQVRVFQMGHAVERLGALQPVADEELPDALRVQYRTLVDQFRRLVERFPAWRALTSKAEAEPLTEEQAEQAVPVARELAAALSTEAAGEVVDADIPNALSGLADAAEAASGAGRVLLNFDLAASANQVMTKLMQPVVFCWKEYGGGAWEELKKTPREAGASTVKWSKRIVFGVVAIAVTTGFIALATQLAAIYPALAWLPSVIAFLQSLAANG